jgi:hypothetical protein
MLLNHMIQVVLSLAVSMLSAWAPLMFYSTSPDNEPVAVRHVEGLVHGFLVLRTLEGKFLAEGDLIQIADGDRVTSKLSAALRVAKIPTTLCIEPPQQLVLGCATVF